MLAALTGFYALLAGMSYKKALKKVFIIAENSLNVMNRFNGRD